MSKPVSKIRTGRVGLVFTVLILALVVATVYAVKTKPFPLSSISNPFKAPPAGFFRVTEVADGDTIVVNMSGTLERIRMVGVDTPETHHPDKPVQCFGQAASNFTTDLLNGKNVRLESDTESTNRDRYDRLLRYVYTESGELVNLELIRQGYGFAYTSFPFTKMEEFRVAEKSAREAGHGLWSGCQVSESSGYPTTGAAN